MDERIAARAADLEWRRAEEQIVILDLRSERYLSLNGSGARLWPLLAAGTTRQELVRTLTEAYPVGGTQAAFDVDRLLGQLAAVGLLERKVAGGPEAPLGT